MMYSEDEYGFHCGNPVCNQRRCFACQNRLAIIYGQWVEVPEVKE